jgi:hypothetical protein
MSGKNRKEVKKLRKVTLELRGDVLMSGYTLVPAASRRPGWEPWFTRQIPRFER